MLALLSTVKSRLEIIDDDSDSILTAAIQAVSARFDKETNRTLARTENFTQEFDGASTEVVATCYPIESVTKFELKTSETEGWVEREADYLLRSGCIISLKSPFCLQSPASCLLRATYTGGYLLPGSPPPDPPVAGCQALPADLEQAAVEQVSYWFNTRDKLGLKTVWPHGGTYDQFFSLDLLPSVSAVLSRYRRWTL